MEPPRLLGDQRLVGARHRQLGVPPQCARVAPNTLDGELLPPLHNVSVVGNLVHDKGYVDAPALAFEWAAQGNGILLAGSGDSSVARNRVSNHPQSGIAILPMLDADGMICRGVMRMGRSTCDPT